MVLLRTLYIILAIVIVSGSIDCSLASQTWPDPDQYWAMIRRMASEKFKGINLELTMNTGYNFGSGDDRGAIVGFSIPIYSKKDKIRVREEATKFLHKGAELVASLQEAMATRKIYAEALRFVQARMNDEGIEAAKAYFDMLTQIAHQDALIVQFHRQLQSLIEPFQADMETFNTEETLISKD